MLASTAGWWFDCRMKNSLTNRLLSLVLLLGSVGLVFGAAYAFRRSCESFGCPNSPILWSAWTILYAVIGAIGLRLRSKLMPGTNSRAIATTSLVVLAVLGITLASYWVLARRAA
jgi:predicted membrane protein